MITNIEKTGVKYDIDETISRYIDKRLGRLDKFLPRSHRKNAILKVVIKQVNRSHGNKYELDAELNAHGKIINAKDEAGNVLAGIDIVEAKFLVQIRKFKAEVSGKGLFARFRKRRK
ncbi:MAG: ribosome-associated translation inhibitor RaiA [Candidatus Nomurabacteria bacterium]|jgi:ribosomal subunit interface protein|nr:ribosome-associated translation inhibitor RaiA [Candidatus Nomurabacteria bacterium]